MERRAFLRRGGVGLGGIATLAGCTEANLEEAEREPGFVEGFVAEEEVALPVTQRLGVAAEGVEAADGVEIPDVETLEGYLVDRGFEVEKVEETTTEHDDEEVAPGLGVEEHEPIVALEYVVGETFERGLVYHLGVVAGAYARLIAADHDSEKLEATLLDPDGAAFGEFEVRRHWAEEYNADELSAREYAGEVLEGAKTK